MSHNIRKQLLMMSDSENAKFQAKLAPSIPVESFLGIRVPDLRSFAKKPEILRERESFIKDLPHAYYDENMLHSIFLSLGKDYDQTIQELENFLPYIDNWAVCDTIKPACVKKHKDDFIVHVKRWIQSQHTYICRFGMGMLMTYYLDEDFQEEYIRLVCSVKSDEYYINMMIAWYLATALAKQWDATILVLEEGSLDRFVHNKTIQKARESFRITPKQKEYLKTLRQ